MGEYICIFVIVMSVNENTKVDAKIIVCQSANDFHIARAITNDYIEWLGLDLRFQNVDNELRDFEQMYGPSIGCFIYAEYNGEIMGGVGCRKLEGSICEMKRLYVYQSFQGLGMGRLLSDKIISIAKSLGYQKMRLDTVSKLESANRLYEKIGFYDIPGYYENPEETVRYMELDLIDLKDK